MPSTFLFTFPFARPARKCSVCCSVFLLSPQALARVVGVSLRVDFIEPFTGAHRPGQLLGVFGPFFWAGARAVALFRFGSVFMAPVPTTTGNFTIFPHSIIEQMKPPPLRIYALLHGVIHSAWGVQHRGVVIGSFSTEGSRRMTVLVTHDSATLMFDRTFMLARRQPIRCMGLRASHGVAFAPPSN